jgi:hypothetical protein
LVDAVLIAHRYTVLAAASSMDNSSYRVSADSEMTCLPIRRL